MDTGALDRHTNIALSFSGGKDSVACVYLLREFLPRITVYHLDTGDHLPETVEIVAQVENMCPRFVRVQTNVGAWIAANGLPSDLVPYGSHPLGRTIGQETTRIAARYDCCFANVMWPLLERMRADGNTLIIRGTKSADMPTLPVANGDVVDGCEVFYPIQGWTDDDVLAYLRSVGAPVARSYETGMNGLDCARCPAWWSEGRGSYLRRYHPALWADYRKRLDAVAGAILGSVNALVREIGGTEGTV